MSEIINKVKQTNPTSYQEELAKTYFPTTPPNANHFTKSASPVKEKGLKQIGLNVILILIGIGIAAFFVFNRIEIKIMIAPLLKNNAVYENKDFDGIYLSKDGEPNRDIVKNIMFYEGADAESGWKDGLVVLSNEVNSRKAIFGIDFKRPVDMSENLLCFEAKGKTGGEELRISLRDAQNNLCYSKINELRDSWQRFAVDLGGIRDLIDSGHITHIDFVINPNERKNLNRSHTYFKDVRFTKRRE